MATKKRTLGIVAATAAALIAGTTTALATSTVGQTITLTNVDLASFSCTNPAGTIFAVPSNNGNTNAVALINHQTNAVTYVQEDQANPGVLAQPKKCVFSKDGTTLYVLNDNANVSNSDQAIVIVNVATATVTGSIGFPDDSSGYLRALEVTPDGNSLLVSAQGGIWKFNISNAGDHQINKSGRNWYDDYKIWQYTPSSNSMQVAKFIFPTATTFETITRGGGISTYNLTTGELIQTIKQGNMSDSTAIHSNWWCFNSDYTLMASFGNNNGDSNVIGIMKTSDGSTVTTATVSSIDVSNGQLGECQFTPGGKLVYSGTKYWATNDPNHPTTGSLFVFDTKTLNLVETIETPAAPNSYAMHIFSDGSAYNVGSSPTAVRVQLDPSYMGAVTKKTKTAKASVVFAAKKSILTAAAKKSLNTVATKYKKSASKIVVTASAPSATAKAKDKNAAKALASKRATAVKNYLKSKGIAVKKITVKTVVVVTKGKKMTAKLKKSVETSNLVITYKG